MIRRNLNFRWLTIGKAEDIWRSVVWFADDYVPAFREIIAIEEEYPSFMDFDLEREGVRQTRSYIDFLRKWTHGQIKHPIMLTDRVPEPKLRWLDKTDLKIDFERFLSELKPKDRQIIALRLKGKTVVLSLEGKSYKAQCKSIVHDGTIISEWFSDHQNAIKDGFYIIEGTCPINSVLPDSVKSTFGERSRNIYDPCVKFEPIGGNTIRFSYGLIVKNNEIRTIDMQQRIEGK